MVLASTQVTVTAATDVLTLDLKSKGQRVRQLSWSPDQTQLCLQTYDANRDASVKALGESGCSVACPASDRGRLSLGQPFKRPTGIAVRPGAKGRGVGQALMGALTDAAIAARVQRLQLGVDPRNLRAVRFYQLQGWTKMQQHTARFDADRDAWSGLMEKALSR